MNHSEDIPQILYDRFIPRAAMEIPILVAHFRNDFRRTTLRPPRRREVFHHSLSERLISGPAFASEVSYFSITRHIYTRPLN